MPPTRPIGASGTISYQGIINTRERNREWVWPRLFDTVDQMTKDPVVRAGLMMVVLPIAEADWTVEPASQEPEDLEAAEFLRRALLEHLDWPKVVWQALPLKYGHAVMEETYEAVEWELSVPGSDGEQEQKPMKVYWVPCQYQQRLGRTIWRWNKDPLARLVSVTQARLDPVTADLSYVDIPSANLVVTVNEQEGDDYLGTSLLRAMYKAWYTKDKLEVIDAIAKERTGVGVPVGHVPDKDWESAAPEMERQLAGLRANEEGYLILNSGDPEQANSGQEVEILDMHANGQADAIKSAQYQVAQILWAVLAAWQNLGQDGVGARATAETQDDPFYLALNFVAKNLASAFNRQAVPRIIGHNFTVNRMPLLKVENVKSTSFAPMVEALGTLIGQGAIETDYELEAFLRKMLGLPEKAPEEEKPEEEEVTAPPPPAPLPSEGDEPPADPEEEGDDPEEVEKDPSKKKGLSAFRLFRKRSASAPTYWRELRPIEKHVQLAQIDLKVEKERERYEAAAKETGEKIAQVLSASIRSGVTPEVPDALREQLTSDITAVLSSVVDFGRMSVRAEIASQRGADGEKTLAGAPPPERPERLMSWINQRARLSQRNVVARLIAKAETLGLMGRQDETMALTKLRKLAQTSLRAEAVSTVSQALSAGRLAETVAAAEDGSAGYAEYSSVLDSGTCGPCSSLDGDRYELDDPGFERDYPPLYACDGDEACRCLMIVVAATEIESEV